MSDADFQASGYLPVDGPIPAPPRFPGGIVVSDPLLATYSPAELAAVEAAIDWHAQDDAIRQAREEAGHQPARWDITDDGRATWALRKVAECQRELDAIDSFAERERLRIAEYVEAAGRDARRFRDFLIPLLQRYGIGYRERTTKATLTLPTGKVATRQGQAKLEVEDPPRAVSVLTDLESIAADVVTPCIRRQDPEPAVGELKKLLVDPFDDRGWFVYGGPESYQVEDLWRAVLEECPSSEDGEDPAEVVDRIVHVETGELAKLGTPLVRVPPFAAVVAFDAGGRTWRFVIPGLTVLPGEVTATVSPDAGPET